MAETRKSVPLASPDFDDALRRLTLFLQSQEELTDYDFDGSTLRVIMRLLAHDAHMNAFYLNMIGNEAFLSTAVRRDNVVKRARDLGYVPRSAKGAIARIRLNITPDVVGPTISIEQFKPFTASDGVNNFVFYAISATNVEPDDFSEYVADIDVVEGKLLTHRFVVTEEEIQNGWTIPNNDVDTAYVYVKVLETGAAQQTTYSQARTIYSTNSEDRKFWIFENEAAHHAISFGDGVIGRKLEIGEVVEVTYLVTNHESANGVGVFTLASPIQGASSVVIETIDFARGGQPIESVESVRFSAPRFYATQGRAVTEQDYKNIILQNFAIAQDAQVWGGQKMEPPQYGKVFISVKPRNGTFLSEAEKARIDDFLGQLKIVGQTPVLVDPEYLYVLPSAVVNYDPAKTLKTEQELSNTVVESIHDFFDANVAAFDRTLRHSRLQHAVDISEESILDTNIGFSLKKKFVPKLGIVQDHLINFGVPILENSVVSGRFTYLTNNNCFFKQKTDGKIDIVQTNNVGSLVVIKQNVGDVEAATGKVDLRGVQIASIPASPEYIDVVSGAKFIPFYATPVNPDITQKFNQIIEVDENRQIVVTLNREIL